MTWTRFDDNWTEKIRAMNLGFQARWHYMSMIQFCSRTDTYDGRMKAVDARTCSDVDDPAECLVELAEHGLVTSSVTRDKHRDVTVFTVVHIDEHLPPPHLRGPERKTAQVARQHRSRAHKAGNHSLCLAEKCAQAPVVTRDLGTGQDGPGLEELPSKEVCVTEQPWPEPSSRPGAVDLTTGEVMVDEDDYERSLGVCRRCGGQGCPDCVGSMERSA